MSFRSPLTGSYRNSRRKDDGRRTPRPSQRKRRQKSRHGIAVVMPPASSGSGSKACRAEFKKTRDIPLIAGTSIEGEKQHGTDNSSKHGSLVHIGTDQCDVPHHLP